MEIPDALKPDPEAIKGLDMEINAKAKVIRDGEEIPPEED